jgi:hypothetical protein
MAAPEFPLIPDATARAVVDLVCGCTFDDFLLTPQRSVVARRDPSVIDLSCRVSQTSCSSGRSFPRTWIP